MSSEYPPAVQKNNNIFVIKVGIGIIGIIIGIISVIAIVVIANVVIVVATTVATTAATAATTTTTTHRNHHHNHGIKSAMANVRHAGFSPSLLTESWLLNMPPHELGAETGADDVFSSSSL